MNMVAENQKTEVDPTRVIIDNLVKQLTEVFDIGHVTGDRGAYSSCSFLPAAASGIDDCVASFVEEAFEQGSASATKKHYYGHDDIGGTYENRELLAKLAGAVNFEDFKEEESRRAMRSQIVECASVVMYEYRLEQFFRATSDESLQIWSKKTDEDPVKQAVKLLLLDFVAQGYPYREFLGYAFDAVAQLQVTYLLG